uniref:DUF4005 domain-containing protein n=2 Tax=Leersia perrieri TaxID=77586 RepID=A0A0D9VPU8_9ORYZ
MDPAVRYQHSVMGKAGRWLRNFLSGGGGKKKEKMQAEAMAALPGKEKRWSFRRPVLDEKAVAAAAELGESGFDLSASQSSEFDQKKQAVALAVATAAAADAAVAAAHAAAAVVRMSSRKTLPPAIAVEEVAAVRIQATFRGYLARTALCALRGIVKLQALVRGQLVRKQATATLRCMQALLTAQSQLRAQAQRMRVVEHHHRRTPPRPRPPSPSPHHPRHRRSYEMDRSCEENAKIVEVDIGGGAARQFECQYNGWWSPAPSSTAYSGGHFDGDMAPYAEATANSSPQNAAASASSEMLHMCPSYMANTESSRAKARSQSAPRQRTDALERQPSRRKSGGIGGGGARMQRSSSSSRGGGAAFAWPVVKLDTSSVSLKDSECGSTSSVLTSATVYSRTRSLVGFEVRRGMY